MLSSYKELQESKDVIPPSNTKQLSTFKTGNNYKHIKGLRKKKNIAMYQPRLSVTYLPNKHNLQKLRKTKNEDETSYIPTTVNGVINVIPTSKTELEFSEQNGNLLKELRETISMYNKEIGSSSKKHKVILTGHSNIKGYLGNLKPLLHNSYELLSIVKSGSTSSELKETVKGEINLLSHDDVIVICSGTNDYEVNEFSMTLHNITNFIKSNIHANIILISVPYRYDLPNSTTVNKLITSLNRKLHKLVKVFPNTSFLETDNTRELFTNHGLHMNKIGKQLVSYQRASLFYSIFAQNNYHPISLGWYDTQTSNLDDEGNQIRTSNRNSSHIKKLPVTRSNDFLWQI